MSMPVQSENFRMLWPYLATFSAGIICTTFFRLISLSVNCLKSNFRINFFTIFASSFKRTTTSTKFQQLHIKISILIKLNLIMSLYMKFLLLLHKLFNLVWQLHDHFYLLFKRKVSHSQVTV